MIWQELDSAPRDGRLLIGCRIRDGEPDYRIFKFFDGEPILHGPFVDGERWFPDFWLELPKLPYVDATLEVK